MPGARRLPEQLLDKPQAFAVCGERKRVPIKAATRQAIPATTKPATQL